MEIYFEENIYMRSNIKDGEKHLIDAGSNVECEAIPPGLSLTVTSPSFQILMSALKSPLKAGKKFQYKFI